MKFILAAPATPLPKPTLSSRRRERRRLFVPFVLFALAICTLGAWSTHT